MSTDEVHTTLSKSLPSNRTMYLVVQSYDTGQYEITCIGIDCVDSDVQGLYDSFDMLPEWVRGKVAVLMLLEPCNLDSHPTRDPQIEGVGSRFTKRDEEGGTDSFWIFPEGTLIS
jgi:hypothetical protein